MTKTLLPIGSVVMLKGGSHRLMVAGRIQACKGVTNVYDYSGVPFPEGMIDSSSMYFFDQEDIERLYFVGMQDEEELKMEEQISNLGELYVNDEGKIVER